MSMVVQTRTYLRRWQSAHRHTLVLGAIVLLALGMRLFRLDYHDYYGDEVISILAARPPLPQIIGSIAAYSTHPPLFYMLLHFWMVVFGEHLPILRLLCVLIGTIDVVLLYALGRIIIADRRVALIGALLFATAPPQIFHSQQIRMYPLLVFAVLLTTLLAVQAWRHGYWLLWVATGLAIGIGFYTHFYAPFSALALNGWAILMSWRERRIGWDRWVGLVGAQGVGFLLFLPFIPQMQQNVSRARKLFWLAENTPFDWMVALVEYSNGIPLLLPENPSWSPRYLVGVGILIIGTIAIGSVLFQSIRIVQQSPRGFEAVSLLHCLIWIPIVLATLISLTIKPILMSRYLIGIAIPIALLFAWVVVWGWEKRKLRMLLFLFFGSLPITLVLLFTMPRWQNESIQVTHWLANEQQSGDAIVLTYWYTYDAMAFAHPELGATTYVAPGPSYDQAFWESRFSYLKWNSPQHIQPVSRMASQYRRIFFLQHIHNRDFAYHHEQHIAWLEHHGTRIMQRDFPDGTQLLGYVMHGGHRDTHEDALLHPSRPSP